MLFLSCVRYAFVRICLLFALWSPAGKGMTSWLSFVMSNYEFVTFPLVSWVRCGTRSYRSLMFALFLTLFKIMLSNKNCRQSSFDKRLLKYSFYFVFLNKKNIVIFGWGWVYTRVWMGGGGGGSGITIH